MRGEYHGLIKPRFLRLELPPRARRIRPRNILYRLGCGTTSACAENTIVWWTKSMMSWNYLRVRGEYENITNALNCSEELPPRARRIPRFSRLRISNVGTTSACAENTSAPWRRLGSGRNYLRVRGEYPKTRTPPRPHQELPPRARRIRNNNQ